MAICFESFRKERRICADAGAVACQARGVPWHWVPAAGRGGSVQSTGWRLFGRNRRGCEHGLLYERSFAQKIVAAQDDSLLAVFSARSGEPRQGHQGPYARARVLQIRAGGALRGLARGVGKT